MSKKYALILAFFIVLYVVFIFVIPPNPALLKSYGLEPLQLQLINATLVVPLAAIWFFAFYGFAKFKEYALTIISNPDGRAFNTLANGLMVLALSLPVSSLVSTVLRYIAQVYPDFTAATVVASRYIALGLAAVAFALIYKGSKNLAALSTKKPVGSYRLWSFIAVLVLGGLYAYVALTNTAGSVPGSSAGMTVYYLPAWLIVATIIIPYVCIWYLGLRSAVFIVYYKRHVTGFIYRRALGSLALGLSVVVGGSIVTQLLTALSNVILGWALQPILILVYLLVGIMAVGYVLIAIGAKKLKKIEEV